MMKRQMMLASALLMALCFSSCFTKQLPPMKFEYSEVVDAPDVTQRQLYLRTVEWFNDNFVSSKSVIQSQDKEDGVFYGKAALQYPHGMGEHYILFSVNVSVKDHKYKYVFKDFRHEGMMYDGKHSYEVKYGLLNNGRPNNSGLPLAARFSQKQWNSLRLYAKDQATKLIESLKEDLSDKSLSEGF